MARPPTSPSYRPYTADSAARPQTAGLSYDHNPQYTYSQEYTIDEDEEEESDAEDVFAFGPPPTAVQSPDQLSPTSFQHIDARPSPIAFVSVDPSRAQPIASPPITFPPPTFDIYARDRTGPTPGPSSLHSRQPYPLSPVETPPSTDSHSFDGNPYKLRRLSQVPSTPVTGTGTGVFSGKSSAISSAGAPISLAAGKEKFRQISPVRPKLKGHPSTPGSASFSSVLEIDSQDGSVKCVMCSLFR